MISDEKGKWELPDLKNIRAAHDQLLGTEILPGQNPPVLYSCQNPEHMHDWASGEDCDNPDFKPLSPLCFGVPGCETLKEIIRLLMLQVREEQALRAAMLKAVTVRETEPVPIPTDSEVDARISELQEIAKKSLTKPGESGTIKPQVG